MAHYNGNSSMSKTWLLLLGAIACCYSGEPREGEAAAHRAVLSDSDISDAHIENRWLDFDGDGTREVVVGVWEGQNSGDWLQVFGRHHGRWSQWLGVYNHHWEVEFFRQDGRDRIRIYDRDAGEAREFSFHPYGPWLASPGPDMRPAAQ